MKRKITIILSILLTALSIFLNNDSSQNLSPYIITKHAKCRMQCRNITKSEIDEVLAKRKVNKMKSKSKGKPCPTLAYEGISSEDNQNIRVIMATCPNILKVVTVIDLDRSYSCHCP